jgi:hypothetical protein
MMTKRNPYTQRQIERAIKAAMACGLKVVAVRPDGTVITSDAETPIEEPGVERKFGDMLGKAIDARKKLGDFR